MVLDADAKMADKFTIVLFGGEYLKVLSLAATVTGHVSQGSSGSNGGEWKQLLCCLVRGRD